MAPNVLIQGLHLTSEVLLQTLGRKDDTRPLVLTGLIGQYGRFVL